MADTVSDNTSTSGSITPGVSLNSEIDTAGDRDWFRVSLQSGQSYQVSLQGASTSAGSLSDPILDGIYDSSGSYISGTYNDDGGSGLNSFLQFTPSYTGIFYISAQGYGTNTGTYTLNVSTNGGDDYGANSVSPGSITVGSSAIGTVEQSSDRDWFAVSLQLGHTYQIDLEGSPTQRGTLSDTTLYGIYDASSNLISGTTNDDGGVSVNSRLEFSPSQSGTYYVAAGGYGISTGTYTLTVQDLGGLDDYGASTSSAGSISINGTVSGNIESANDTDWFRVNLAAGQSVQIDLLGSPTNSGTLGDTYLRGIYDSSGAFISGTSNDDGGTSLNSRLEFTASQSGDYYIVASAYDSNTGTYQVSVTSLANGDDYGESVSSYGQGVVNGSVTGEIEEAGDQDWFAVTLQASHSYTFSLEGSPTSAGTLSDTYLRGIYDSSSTYQNGTANDDGGTSTNSLVEFVAPSSGTYFVAASAYSSDTGTYRLTITDSTSGGGDDFGSTVSSAGQISVGGSRSGSIESQSDEDWFAISLQSGEQIRIDLEGAPTSRGTLSDAYFNGVYDSSGNLISGTSDDDSGSGFNSQIEFTASGSGTYYLSASSYYGYTGTYTLSVTSLGAGSQDDYGESAGSAGSVQAGSYTTGNIEVADDYDWFALDVSAGQAYVIDLEGTPTSAGTLSDTYMHGIYDSSGNFISGTSDDDSGVSRNSQVEFVAPSSGRVYISAGAFGSNTGSYKLSVSGGTSSGDDYGATISSAGSIQVNSSATGNVEQAADVDWFAITMQAGQTYEINLEGSPTNNGTLGDTYLYGVYDSNGFFQSGTANDDGGQEVNSAISFQAPSSGTYYIAAGGYGSETGTYKLSVSAEIQQTGDDFSASSSTAGRVSVGTPATGVIETANDQDWFSVQLTAGQSYSIGLEGSPTQAGSLTDTYLRGIYDNSGNLISSTSNDDGGVSSNSLLQFTATSTGTHYIAAGAYGLNTGSYTLSVSTSSTGSGGGIGGGSSGGSGSGATGDFNIVINYTGDARFRSVFEAAAARWAQVITGDLPDASITPWGFIDDLVIDASVVPIDGVGSVLGQAGGDYYRGGARGLALHGSMAFDSADMANMDNRGILSDVILHEMGHVLGISRWAFADHGIASGTQYTGSNALNAYRTLTGNTSVTYVPLEDGGGDGTRLSHWDEELFGIELMTGFAESRPPMPLSILTIGALADLGYTVNTSAADQYSLTTGQSLQQSFGLQTSSLLTESSVPDAITTAVQPVISGFSGSVFVFNEDKPLVLTESAEIAKLEGTVTSANENVVFFLESTSGLSQLVRLDGQFEKNSPSTVDNIKGMVSAISFLSGSTSRPTSLTYSEPVAITSVLNNWQAGFTQQNNWIEVVSLSASNDTIHAGLGNDYVSAGLGNDNVDGGGGIDTVIYSGTPANYTITGNVSSLQVRSLVNDTVDSLANIERLKFDASSLAFDLDGNAGSAAKLIGVMVGASQLSNQELSGTVLHYIDALGYEQAMGLAISHVLGASHNATDVVNLLATNIFGAPLDAATTTDVAGLVSNGTYTEAGLAIAAAELAENTTNINLVGISQSGLGYIEFTG